MISQENIARSRPLKVLIVDDSEALCLFLRKVISRDPEMEVVGYALDPYEARDKIKQMDPDILTLDVEMPRMDGLTFLRNLMRLRPMPVVMISSLTAAGAEVTLDALDAGAVDFMVKRHPQTDEELDLYSMEIARRVKQAGQIKLVDRNESNLTNSVASLSEYLSKMNIAHETGNAPTRVIAIGSSTGGPDALKHFLKDLHAPDSALLFAQHMPDRFMKSFADRLNTWSSFNISIAKPDEKLQAGRGYVAPGDDHLELTNTAGVLSLLTRKTDLVNGHRPSVDVLFKSVAKAAPAGSIGVLLTGMGSDGAIGLKQMRSAGALTIIQDEKSSAVWGMPGRAHEMGAADSVLSLLQIGPSITSLLKKAA
ncbi:MAG: two-component system chemotaxis response regulator CheB [Granulosicoccus sp.]|jgi:two-component system chemotaxis response regulator CheB